MSQAASAPSSAAGGSEAVGSCAPEGGSNSTAPGESKTTAGEVPVVVIVVGMAGSGKTTLLQRVTAHLYGKQMEERAMALDRVLEGDAQDEAKTTDPSDNSGAAEQCVRNDTTGDEASPADVGDRAEESNVDGGVSAEGSNEESALPPRKEMYLLNLDPAVMHVPFPINIDIRDTIDYKEVMSRYGVFYPLRPVHAHGVERLRRQ